MAPSTILTDTELSAVNSILGAIGQAPISALPTDYVGDNTEYYQNPEIALIYNILTEVNKDVQNEGWHFNTEDHVKVTLNSHVPITLPSDSTYETLRYDFHDAWDRTYDVVERNGVLYDLVEHTSTFKKGDYYLDIVRLFKFDNLPNVFQRYITHKASVRAAAQMVSNPTLVQLLQQQEIMARAACIEYDTDQGDHNFMGFDHGTVYRTYQPHIALRR